MSKRSVTEIQTQTLGQFRYAAQGNQHEKNNEYVTRARQLKEAFEKKRKIETDTSYFQGGLNNTQIEQAKSSIQKRQELYNESIKTYHESTDIHIMLREARSMFDSINIYGQYDASNLLPLRKESKIVYDLNGNLVELIIGKTLNKVVKISINITYIKPYYRKADDFELTKRTVRDFKELHETKDIKVTYGDYKVFMKSLFSQLNTIIKKFDLYDPSLERRQKDIWSFDFS